jgi:hypothetical protein
MFRSLPFAVLLALLVLVQPAQAAAPTKHQCKVAKAKKHKTKHDRKTIAKCAKAAKSSAKKKPAPKKPAPAVPAPAPPTSVTAAAAAPAPAATPAPVVTPAPPAAPDVPQLPIGTGRAVQVRGFEFGLNLSRATVVAGQVRVEFNLTSAEDPHTLVLERTDGTGPTFRFDSQGSGQVTAQSLNLSAGTWHLYCDLPGHALWGMKVDLEVR